MKGIHNQAFAEEFCSPDSSKGPSPKLKPFSNEGLLRVGGRLDCANLDYDAKHLMMLPGKDCVTDMILLYYHFANGHVGPYQVLTEIRQHFGIVNGISSIRCVLRQCHEWKRQNATLGEQITAPLPAVSFIRQPPVDLYICRRGYRLFWATLLPHRTPYQIDEKELQTSEVSWMHFHCLGYRAVHIEITGDLSTDSFINVDRRFLTRRG